MAVSWVLAEVIRKGMARQFAQVGHSPPSSQLKKAI